MKKPCKSIATHYIVVMQEDFFRVIDLLGTVAFATSGVFAAMEKRLDVFGVLIIAFVTAVGGGTIRDIMIGNVPVTWIRTLNYSLTILITVVLVIVFKNAISKNFPRTLLIFDSIGLGFFTVSGIQKGIVAGLDPAICIALGTITGCFGGVIRDISLNTIPLIFRKEIYATACIIGGCIYFMLVETGMNVLLIEAISIFLVFLVRILAVRYDWRLPNIYGRMNQDK